jgi:hypothetical protein
MVGVAERTLQREEGMRRRVGGGGGREDDDDLLHSRWRQDRPAELAVAVEIPFFKRTSTTWTTFVEVQT